MFGNYEYMYHALLDDDDNRDDGISLFFVDKSIILMSRHRPRPSALWPGNEAGENTNGCG